MQGTLQAPRSLSNCPEGATFSRLRSAKKRSSLRLITGDFYAVGQVGHPLSTDRLMTLSAFSLASFGGGIAGVASGLPVGFQGGFPRCPLSEFRIAGRNRSPANDERQIAEPE